MTDPLATSTGPRTGVIVGSWPLGLPTSGTYYRDLAQQTESLGYDLLFSGDHLFMYSPNVEALTVLATFAAATESHCQCGLRGVDRLRPSPTSTRPRSWTWSEPPSEHSTRRVHGLRPAVAPLSRSSKHCTAADWRPPIHRGAAHNRLCSNTLRAPAASRVTAPRPSRISPMRSTRSPPGSGGSAVPDPSRSRRSPL